MTDASANTRRKWRPSLSLVVFIVLTSVLSLPLFSLYFLKVYQTQLIQQTEAELIEELRRGRHEAVWLAGAAAK